MIDPSSHRKFISVRVCVIWKNYSTDTMAFRFPVGVVDLERAVVRGMTEALRMHGVDVPDPDGERRGMSLFSMHLRFTFVRKTYSLAPGYGTPIPYSLGKIAPPIQSSLLQCKQKVCVSQLYNKINKFSSTHVSQTN